MSEQNKPDVVQGYKVLQSISIGGKSYVIAENPKAVQPWVTWVCRENRLFKSYDHGHYFSDYLPAMIDLTERVREDAQIMLDIQESNKEASAMLLSEEHCISGSRDMNYKDQYIIMNPDSLLPEYRNADNQLYLAVGGFGCSPTASGRAVYCKNLIDGEEERWDRANVLGVADRSKLPEWAQNRIKAFEQLEMPLARDR
ncbi:hypothetical protein LJC56_08700 [Christensenellaceae bacterium OttesenSCG-928-K19]|nr:hypothetical protein [Christensenellaceae bacterium OttesenSCG-928-K19]